jgi:exosortase family protein XrtF
MKLLQEFKPALFFLGKFLAVYLVGNILYGFFVESYHRRPDPATIFVSNQSASILQIFDTDVTTEINPNGPTSFLKDGTLVVLSVYEGCNGINVMVVFLAFVIAFGGPSAMLSWFIPAGLLLVHAINLGRIVLLFRLAQTNTEQFYYFHKYIFTGILYVGVFMLWSVWIWLVHGRAKRTAN